MRALAPEVRFLLIHCTWLLGDSSRSRTSAAKAAHSGAIYGTAEAVPFVESCVDAPAKRFNSIRGEITILLPLLPKWIP
jgi:hypothetical protein